MDEQAQVVEHAIERSRQRIKRWKDGDKWERIERCRVKDSG